MQETDLELLSRYAQDRAEDAFAELVRRHTNLVFSAALRQVQCPHLAQDIAQSVFTDLASQAPRWRPGTPLQGWLFQVTRRTAIDLNRREARRRARESAASADSTADSPGSHLAPDPLWIELAPLIDEAVHALDEPDRLAVLLRFFENQPLRRIGEVFGISDDAAQKRVTRALERLRDILHRHGLKAGGASLAATLSGHAIQAAPAGLAAALASATATVAATGAVAGSLPAAAPSLLLLSMNTAQKAALVAAVGASLSWGVLEHRRHARLEDSFRQLRTELAAAEARAAELAEARQDLRKELERSRSDSLRWQGEAAALSRTRAELQAQRNAAAPAPAPEPAPASPVAQWQARAAQLQRYLADNPKASIPELALTDERDLLEATRDDLATEEDFRRAASTLRRKGEERLAPRLQKALARFAEASAGAGAGDGAFPATARQLVPYFDPPIDDQLLTRYAILPRSEIPSLGVGGDLVITPRSAIDPQFDCRFGIGLYGWGVADPKSWSAPRADAN